MPEVLKRVGRFDLLEVIGRGGAAVVYLAVQRDLQRNVALKELAPFALADSTFAERFVEESRLAGSMNHANVVTVHEYFEDGGVPYIAMEYLPHGSLRHYIGRLSTAQIIGVLEGVLAGLAHGESRRIVHRDLKPENLLVALDGRVKIADFGVARAYSKAATRAVVTVAGTTIGTPTYMSPEQALGSDLTPATDLYSLGVVAWELLSGEVPFEETDTPVAVLYRHVHEEVPSVRTVAPDVDERIDRWLQRMLAKRPEDRYPGADAAWLELEDIALELLGPRWRREARLPVDDPGSRAGQTLTPASFSSLPAPDTPIPETISGPAAPAAEAPAAGRPAAAAEPTIAPARRRRRSNTTMLRIARRHHADGDGPDAVTAPETRRRWLVVGAIVLAMAAAATAGILLGQPAAPARHGPSQAQLRAVTQQEQRQVRAATTDKQLAQILERLARRRVPALVRSLNAAYPATQSSDAAIVQRAYATAATRAAPLAGQSPEAAPLAATLKTLAQTYAQLTAAGRADDAPAWNRARATIKADERQLQTEIGLLSG